MEIHSFIESCYEKIHIFTYWHSSEYESLKNSSEGAKSMQLCMWPEIMTSTNLLNPPIPIKHPRRCSIHAYNWTIKINVYSFHIMDKIQNKDSHMLQDNNWTIIKAVVFHTCYHNFVAREQL